MLSKTTFRNTSAPSQVERAREINIAMRDVEKHHAKRKLHFALKYRGPYVKESSELYASLLGQKYLFTERNRIPGVGRIRSSLKMVRRFS